MEYKNPKIVVLREDDSTVAALMDGDAIIRTAAVPNIVPAFGTDPLDFEDCAAAALDRLFWGHRPKAENTQGLVVGDIVRVTAPMQAFEVGDIGQVSYVYEADGAVAVTAPIRTLAEPFLMTQSLRFDMVEKVEIK